MVISDLLKETYSALFMNKARSGLTILGIVIGIGSVIALVSVGQGATSSIESNIEALGSNLIMVTPGAQRSFGSQVRIQRGSAQTLTLEDAESLDSISTVRSVAPEVSGRYQVTAKGSNTNTQIVGITTAYAEVKNIEVQEGDFISDQNISNISKVAVIGPTVWEDLFGTSTDPIGQIIRIKSIQFKIIGITAPKGGTGFSNQDDMIYIPISTAQKFLSGNSYVTTINVEAIDQESMTAAQEEITASLLQRHNISDSAAADFSTINQADIISSASSISGTLSMLLGSIAGISLLVGGIGIMNMMLTTVTERTREIGLRKAIGAKKKDISLQFLTEAVMLTFIGGVVGIILGCLAALILSHFNIITTKISSASIVLAFGVSAAIGIIFGYYPARRASNLNPIEALRYE
jgi:putative ABC transport system permease protein